jgi:adenylosuccinate synthase
MNVDVIIGALFGDEGKGSFVNYKCSTKKKPLVVRFNGGHQVGHTVVIGDKRHVFSNFGSGTLQGAPTYWSRFCTVSPIGLLKEGKVLREMGIDPVIYFDLNAMITTPFDILRNIANDDTTKHGSVGVGFGQTIQRNKDHYCLYVRDLLYPEIRDAKLQNIINKYYRYNFNPKDEHQHAKTRKIYNDFLVACDDLVERYDFMYNLKGFYDHDLIFEGGQGIMLDMNYGFFPNVTRSNCTAKNALELIKESFSDIYINTYYITRAYQTRHGNGYMTNEDLDTSYIIDNPNETNRSDGFQGEFRKSVLDLDMLKYAIGCDNYENPKTQRFMVVTCLDQVPARIPVTTKGKLIEIEWNEIPLYCGITHRDSGPDFCMYHKYGSWSEQGVKKE